jgi:hypothetical protein
VDPGDAEEGYRGNGTPALERDPDEVVMTAIPLGCARKDRLPRPTHVLEVDYRFRDTSVIALRLRFARAQDARTFHVHRRDSLRACQGRSGGRAIGVLVRTVRLLDRGAVLSDRTPDSDPWSELAVLDGSEVVLLAARSRPDRPPLTIARAPALAAAFSR